MKKLEQKCHRCNSKDLESIKICSNVECKHSFCSRCLIYRYKTDPKTLSEDWQCFICEKTCACKSCRKEATSAKTKKIKESTSNESHACHQCNKKISTGKYTFCEKCKNYLCFGCSEIYYKNLENCPICLDICTCKRCGDLRFNKDFPEFNKGVDLRVLYPYDLDNIFYVNGFWVRSINL